MANQPTPWVNTCNRLVAFLDIMGFKDWVFRNKHESVLKDLKAIERTVSWWGQLADRDPENDELAKNLGVLIIPPKPVLFSDSILLVSRDDSEKSAFGLLVAVRNVFRSAMEAGIPLKGSLAYGQQTADFKKSLHFGQPLIDAYELQNELQNELHLYGVVLHHTMEHYLTEKKTMEKLENVYIFKYAVPLKAGVVDHYMVSWIESLLENAAAEEIFRTLYGKVSGSTRLYVDNTKEFADWQVEEKKKGAQGSPIT